MKEDTNSLWPGRPFHDFYVVNLVKLLCVCFFPGSNIHFIPLRLFSKSFFQSAHRPILYLLRVNWPPMAKAVKYSGDSG